MRRRLNVSTVPNYQKVLQLGKGRRDALFLDLGCACACLVKVFLAYPDGFSVGTDIRKLIQDGYPAQNVIASDLRPGQISHTLLSICLTPR